MKYDHNKENMNNDRVVLVHEDAQDDTSPETEAPVAVRRPVLLHMDSTASFTSDVPMNARSYGTTSLRYQRWELNYHEAAIYLQEGENNDKFATHPRSQEALPAYILTHNTWVYMMELCAALTLMCLAFVEAPSVEIFQIHIAIHSSIELLCLLIIGVELSLRLKWLGFKNFTHHVRTMIKATTLIVMIIEAIVVLVRQASHFRVTRALRPLLLLDTNYFRGSRRFVRQIILSLPPILDMLVLLMFVMLIFSILGFYLFSSVPQDQYFQNIQQSFISLFVLLTTANYPDVMMPAYKHSRWSALFFVCYLVIELYFIMNLLLAVVYDTFLRAEKTKLQKLWLHERAACRHSFRLLVSAQDPEHIKLKHFKGLMQYYRPKASRRDVYLMFKMLNRSQSGTLTLEEFFKVYEVAEFKWQRLQENAIWSTNFYYPFNRIFHGLHWFATWHWFDYAICFTIVLNFVWIVADTITISASRDTSDSSDHAVYHFNVTWYDVMFSGIYVLEALIKIFGVGPVAYFGSGWNVFDFLVTLLAVTGVVLEVFNNSFYYIIVLRPFRLLRLFKVKRRYRDVLGTMRILMSRMISLAVVMIMLFYFFAILGIELFSHYDMVDCCKNSSVKSYYEYSNSSNSYYYLNNFQDLTHSAVTLFELTVVNNWYIIMEGYAYVASEWSRVYFMIFYIVTMVVLTVVVAFILEAFLFRIQYQNKMKEDMDDDTVVKQDMCLTSAELRMCTEDDLPFTGHHINQLAHLNHGPVDGASNGAENKQWFRGDRTRGRNEFGLLMYEDEVQEWLIEDRQLEEEEMQQLAPRLQRNYTV